MDTILRVGSAKEKKSSQKLMLTGYVILRNKFKHLTQWTEEKDSNKPDADLANVEYELSSKGRNTNLTTKLPKFKKKDGLD